MPSLVSRLLASTVLAVAMPIGLGGGCARAEAASQSTTPAETVRVVSQSRLERRHKTLQHSAASSSMLSAQRLAALGVTSTRQITNLTPNLYQPRATVGYSNSNYFIRGIGELDPQGEPSVGTYIDGVYLPRTIGTMQELLDIEDIQVDRGPVGFTTGHQAEGGAVRITTVVPGDKTRFVAETGYGSYNEWKTGFAASGPLIRDKVYASLAFEHHGRDGTDHNYTLDKDVNTIDYTQARAKLRFTPNDTLDITLAFDGTVDGSTNRGYANLLNRYRYGAYSIVFPKNNYSEAGFTGTAIQTLGPHLDLRSITAVRGYDDTGAYDNTGDVYARTSQLLYYRDRAYSQEFRLDGQWNRLSITTGAYGFFEEWYTARRANNTFGALSNDPNRMQFQPVNAVIDQKNWNAALYGIAHYKVLPTVTLSAGLRLNGEWHSNSETLRSLGPVPGFVTGVGGDLTALYDTPPGALNWAVSARGHWFRALPKGSIEWQLRPNVMLYATISQGGKSAGYDYRAQNPAVPRQAVLPYGPETVTTYEVGAKTDPIPNRFWINTALFYNDFNDIQITTSDPSTGLSRRYNAGNGHSWGAEIEGTLHPLRGVEVAATGSYLFAQLDRFDGNAVSTLYPTGLLVNATPHDGERLPFSPRFQGDLSASYSFDVPRVAGQFRVGGDASFQSAVFTDALENGFTRLPDQVYLNAQLSWVSPSRRWSAALTGRNLGDRRYPQSLSLLQRNGVPLLYSAAFADPRTLFLSLRYAL
ncbi:TonB-dependent receptor [Acetobacteraceae bacterium KSS8]|uniref:TonB-dependent receptor n=1 Tax=Endosaccharibacter trunci TaxID=2812733 RepID=A0ABT1W5F5_9PROT|nr:TonB-dependent receptor [Acetobacteraceae bacterium KSS8]